MPAAVTIDDVIAFASTDVANLSYGGVDSLFVAMGSWNDGMFLEGGIFPPTQNATRELAGQRLVTDWYAAHVKALAAVQSEGITPGTSGVVGTSACIDAIVRVAWAVKEAALSGEISGTQQTAVIALYNLVWS